MAKDLKSILAGVKSSKIAPPPIDDKNMYQWNGKDGVAFIKKHKIETHADRVGNGDDVYKGKTKKTDKYKFQSDGVYEETEEEDELDEAARVRFIGKQNPADLPPRPADYKPGDFGSKLAAQGGLRYPGKKKPSRPLPVKESEINEGNKENKAKKKAVMVDKPKQKEKEFDPREFFSAARRGRQMEENFDGMKSLKSQVGLRSPKALAAFVKNKKDGGSKTTKYKFQKDGVYEETEIEEGKWDYPKYMTSKVPSDHPYGTMGPQQTKRDERKSWRKKIKAKAHKELMSGKKLGESSCNHTNEGEMCEVHGESACPTKENDVNTQKPKKKDSKGREYLADKKKCMDEASQYRSTYGMGKRGWASSKAGKVTFQDKAYLPSGPKKEELRAAAEKANTSGVKVTKLPAGKAKGIKEEVQYIEEVLTAKDPVSKWIHDFVHSDNPKFTGKSTKERQKMALGAYYDKKRGVKESGSATNTDYAGPGAAGWTTGRHDMGTL